MYRFLIEEDVVSHCDPVFPRMKKRGGNLVNRLAVCHFNFNDQYQYFTAHPIFSSHRLCEPVRGENVNNSSYFQISATEDVDVDVRKK